MAKKPIPLPVQAEETPEEDCPKCPPVGAPAWMATFADMATLLMAFFVLILSFAEFNQPKFKMIAGSLKNSFGVQKQVPVMEQPKGTTILKLEFSPSPDPAVIKEITQETTETEKKQIETKPDETEGDGAQGEGGEAQDKAQQEAMQELAEALSEAMQSGAIEAKVENGQVTMNFNGQAESAEQLAEQLSEAAEAMAQAQAQTGANPDDVKIGGLADDLKQMAEMAQGAGAGEGAGGGAEAGDAARKAGIAAAELQVALRQELGQGLVTVEQEEGKVKITVGAGGAFPSGTADLTAEAQEIMSRIAFASMDENSSITVTGHTDDVPVNPSSEFRDNIGLAAARASSVVREMANSGLIDASQLTAVSKGESDPVADNNTAEGREQNRRIEIEISY
jgi:chemotaxis protein MotB